MSRDRNSPGPIPAKAVSISLTPYTRGKSRLPPAPDRRSPPDAAPNSAAVGQANPTVTDPAPDRPPAPGTRSGAAGNVASLTGSRTPPAPPAPPRTPAAPMHPQAAPTPRRWPAGGALLTGFLGIALLFGGFGAWAFAARIAGAIVAPGQIEVELQRQVVQHPEGGVVESIAVTEGQRVAAGDPLIRLDGALLKTEFAIVEGQYLEILARRGRLEAERADQSAPDFSPELIAAAAAATQARELMEGQRRLFHARLDTLAQSLDQLAKQSDQVGLQIEGIDAQSAALGEQRNLLAEELEDAQTLLRKGLAQAPRVLALQRQAAAYAGQLGELKAARAEAETRRTEIGITRLRAGAERRELAEAELRDLGYRELELAERRRSLAGQIARLEIRAPVAGIVHQLQVTTPRAVIRPAEPVMFLIPQDRPLVIAARIATIDIDELEIGQAVALRFPAFSSRTTPEIAGILARVSADAVVEEQTGASFYRAEVTIPPDQRSLLGDLVLVPGMPVEVYIQTGERSPFAYLVKPLSDYFARAFRES